MQKRKIAAVALAFAVAFGTTGCSFNSPVASLEVYDPSDGVNANIGNVQVRNFMYLTTAAGDGALFGSIVNQAFDAKAVTVELHAHGSSSTATIPVAVGAGEKLDLGYNGGQAIPLGVSAKAGSLIELHVEINGEEITLNVPVLDGTFKEYAPLVNSIPTQGTSESSGTD